MQFLVYGVAFLVSVAQALIALAVPNLAIDRFQALNFHLGLLAAGGAGIYTVVALSSGRISERLPIRFQLSVSTFLLATSCCFMAWSPTFVFLFLLNVVNGITTGLLWAPLEGVLSRLSRPEHMRRNVGRYNLSWSLGMAVGFYLYAYSTNVAFAVGAALTYATAVLLLFLRATDAGKHVAAEAVGGDEQVSDHRHRFFLVTAWTALFATYVAVAAARSLFPKLATELEISKRTMGHIYGIGLFAQTLSMAAMGRFEGWHYRKWIFYLGEIGVLLGTVLIALGRETVVLSGGHVVLGFAMAVIYSCSLYYSMQDPVRAHHNTSVHEGLIGTAASMPVLLGCVADYFRFTPLSFYIAGVVMLAILGVHSALFVQHKKVVANTK